MAIDSGTVGSGVIGGDEDGGVETIVGSNCAFGCGDGGVKAPLGDGEVEGERADAPAGS